MLNILSIQEDDKNNIVPGLLERIKVRDKRISALEVDDTGMPHKGIYTWFMLDPY